MGEMGTKRWRVRSDEGACRSGRGPVGKASWRYRKVLRLLVGLLGWLVLVSSAVDARPVPHSQVDAYALAAKPGDEVSLDSLAAYLSGPKPRVYWDPRTKFWVRDASVTFGEEQKARAIYRWVTRKIRYDLGERGTDDAERVLRTRRAVCAGYSRLFEDLSRRVGLQALYVGGRAPGPGYNSHAWNALRVGGRWLFVDSTWGSAQSAEGRRDWFLVPPVEFLQTHFPDPARGQVWGDNTGWPVDAGHECYAFLKQIEPRRLRLLRSKFDFPR